MLGTYRNFIGNNPYRHIESHAKDDCRRKCPGDECCKRLPMMQQMSKVIFDISLKQKDLKSQTAAAAAVVP